MLLENENMKDREKHNGTNIKTMKKKIVDLKDRLKKDQTYLDFTFLKKRTEQIEPKN